MTTNRCSVATVILLLLVSGAVIAQDGGGTSGADFLLNPSAPRSDSMGGVVDGQGDSLEGMFFNPSILMLDPNIQLSIGITPLPNGVTDASLSFGAPVASGMIGIAAQLLSAGEFTYVNEVGQPQGSLTLFDAAAAAGYSMYVWDRLSVGASAKVVYRALGDWNALGAGADLGATWWFETPHVGQRPKPPTMEQLQAQLERDLASLESEKARRTREAAGDVADLRDDVIKLQASLDKIRAGIAAAEEGEDTTRLETSESETEGQLAATEAGLAEAEAAAADDLASVEEWYDSAVAEAEAAHARRVADLREVESERARLFEVVNDPDLMLTADVIVSNIEDAIDRTRQFRTERSADLRDSDSEFKSSRQERIAEIVDQIAAYEQNIVDVLGPDSNRLRSEIDTLTAEVTRLEAAEGDEAADQLKAARSSLDDARKTLDQLQSDPWVRRLQRRIDDQETAAASLQAEIEEFSADTESAIELVGVRAERDIADFETLSDALQTDLRRAQLRLELDLIDARSERSTERANLAYETSEQAIYQRLLAAMYENEEKIFDSRIALANQDSQSRRFETEGWITNERSTEEDNFAFQERFLTRQIADLNGSEPVDTAALDSARESLATLREEHENKMTELDGSIQRMGDVEDARLRSEIAAIREERRKIRLIYLQTDDPYQNTAITLAIRNLGTNLKFDTTGYPMPRSAALGVSYGIVNTEMHSLRVSSELELPLYSSPTFSDLQVGVGLEYGFAGLLDVRAGYAFGSPDRSLSVGFGASFALGFTSYAIDYTARPIPNYGFVHSFGVAIGL